MISIVVCSINTELAKQVKSNIDNTVGAVWEAIIIDNSVSPRGITDVYNDGARRAKFPIVCFVHEDVAFETADWGRLVIHYFNEDKNLGMLGIAGARYKSRTPSGWMTSVEQLDRYTITHVDAGGAKTRMQFDQAPGADLKDVVCLDGVFFCIRKELLMDTPFDETNLKKFHLYDIDISTRIARSHRVAVCFTIDVLHFTEGGDYGDKWVEETLAWHRRRRNELPTAIPSLQRDHKWEARVRRFWLRRLRTEKISMGNKFRWIFSSGSLWRPRHWPDVFLFFFFRSLKSILRRN